VPLASPVPRGLLDEPKRPPYPKTKGARPSRIPRSLFAGRFARTDPLPTAEVSPSPRRLPPPPQSPPLPPSSFIILSSFIFLPPSSSASLLLCARPGKTAPRPRLFEKASPTPPNRARFPEKNSALNSLPIHMFQHDFQSFPCNPTALLLHSECIVYWCIYS
jgi:hypothetical protein